MTFRSTKQRRWTTRDAIHARLRWRTGSSWVIPLILTTMLVGGITVSPSADTAPSPQPGTAMQEEGGWDEAETREH